MEFEFNGFNASVIGSSHISLGIVCQDSSETYYDDKIAIAIVCDGHGDKKHFRSDIGSRLATEIGINAIKSFMSEKKSFIHNIEGNFESIINHLEKYIVFQWNEAVNLDFKNNNFSKQELDNLSKEDSIKYENKINVESAYGTTFLAVVRTNEFWFAIQIGDSDCVVVYDDGEFVNPIPDDEKCRFNVTTSLCDKEAIKNFRHHFNRKQPIAIFASTDGVSNSFMNDEYFRKFLHQILISFGEGPRIKASQELEEYLPRLSAMGSGDDVSIALVYDAKFDYQTLPNTFSNNAVTEEKAVSSDVIITQIQSDERTKMDSLPENSNLVDEENLNKSNTEETN